MKKLLSVTFFSGLLTLAKMGSGFVIAKVVAIYTGPSGMAMLGQVQSVVSSLNGIVNASVGSGIVRYTAEYEKDGVLACSPWWRASLWWLAIILVVLIPLGFLLAKPLAKVLFGNFDYAWIIWGTTVVLPLTAVGSLINSVINGYQQYRRYITLGAISVALSCALMVVLIINYGITGALCAAVIQSGLVGIVMLISALRQPWFVFSYWWGKTDKEYKKSIGGYILMAITSALATPIALIGVRNILVSQVGWDNTGHWQAVWKISEVYLGVVTVALSTYFLPKLATLKGVGNIRKEINQTALIVIPIVALMAICVYFFRDVVITILFTEAFRAARDLFAIQLVGDVMKIICWLYAYPMLSRGATKWFVAIEIFLSITLFIFTWLFVPVFSTQGANIAYLANYVLGSIVIYLSFGRFSK
ncbi:O-antigen translocase [Pectobacterium carotovorum]|uniref:O-antigen translocase n=1 Tax=Pectobacterium carotovorum TaxID=554 RepID=UPI000D731269|nr:O-antigen translocase [Pectobacterium carotovorum]PXB03282.1 O-antigen flippase [Pectobacterium carotovorum subsp. carotovorum]